MNINEISINDEKKSRHYLKSYFLEKNFLFSRYDGSYSRRIQLGASGVIENIDGKGNPNESFWEFENNELVLLDSNRDLTSRYFCIKDKANGLYLLGYYERNKEIIFKLEEVKVTSLRSIKKLKFDKNVVIFNDILFLHQENSSQRQFQVLMGEVGINANNIDNFHSNMKHNLEIAKRDGFAYKHIVFPAKPIVYEEHFKEIGVNLNSIFSEDFYHSEVAYPKLSVEDYHLHDTHINDVGSFKVISKVLQMLNYPSLPLPLFINAKKNGDLMKMLGRDDTENIKIINGFTGLLFKPLEFNLGAALKGNTGDVKILFNPKALYNSRLMLFGDSFFEFTLRVYSSLFTEVIYFRKPYILDDVVKILKPDIVLTANTERYLCSVPNCHKDTPWFMNYLNKRFNGELLSNADREAFEAMFSGKGSKLYKKKFGDLLRSRPDYIKIS